MAKHMINFAKKKIYIYITKPTSKLNQLKAHFKVSKTPKQKKTYRMQIVRQLIDMEN